jgi:hypothetical protein
MNLHMQLTQNKDTRSTHGDKLLITEVWPSLQCSTPYQLPNSP